ncbi:hypothetical protein GQ43DRAFT_383712 [Delitschia confertaspora ATCC 74209]|uniref:tRNA/rRNA methyltransferase SpoU type domain-containing protein n=1 Tax=Delitschia confertaspora ATCC 74209 TaxID=1513339 RepID=A0A9P4JBI5_9PLEO|nr:hypothetical protein GQ43DRAFT_383712 [Delitschia confertaspora ATCC 74209]
MPTVERSQIYYHGENSDTKRLFGEQLWERICALLQDGSRFATAGQIFKLWFQWDYQTGLYGPRPEHFQEDRYWSMLQSGLLHGFAEQRKYCLGILQSALPKVNSDIHTQHMTFSVEERQFQESRYEKYCTLFEAIVLDRYANQVEACLGDLTILMAESHVHPAWMTTMLSAALNPKVQDGIRKIIGNWYIDFIKLRRGPLASHSDFVIQGFLPWATQGFLFTGTLRVSRDHTICEHGTALSRVIGTLIQELPTISDKREFSRAILQFVVDKRGRIFVYSILYLLEGILHGLRTSSSLGALESNDLALILQVSRHTGLPEIARDFCTTLCMQFFEEASSDTWANLAGYDLLRMKWRDLNNENAPTANLANLEMNLLKLADEGLSPLAAFRQYMESTKYKAVQGVALSEACGYLLKILDSSSSNVSPNDLLPILEAIWDEADTQEYARYIVRLLPPLFFHPRCVETCIEDTEEADTLHELLAKVLTQLHHFAEGRSYLLATLTDSLRRACLMHPQALELLPMEDFLVRFVEHPPAPKDEFLFEVVFAEELETYLPHRTYASYYGQRETHAYANIIDLLNRFPIQQLDVAKRVMDRLLRPWAKQKPPIPIISKWKEAFQLQVMLILTESCVGEEEVDSYLTQYRHALTVESWPRYRYLFEWIVARIYMQYPDRAKEDLLANVSTTGDKDNVPRLVASWIKLSVMVASFQNDCGEYALRLMTHLIPLSASPKVQIRHEAHWSVPIVWDLAEQKGWRTILENPAFKALNEHIRQLDQFTAPATTSRKLKLDPVDDYTLVNIFQGEYMRTDQVELEKVSYEDFMELGVEDERKRFTPPLARIPLGEPLPTPESAAIQRPSLDGISIPTTSATATSSTPLQTKATSIATSLLATPSSLSTSTRPTPLILVASLIDNPTNLGGLSRISEIFGLEALYLRSLDVLGSKDFQSTAVTSHKHLPIKELKVGDVPQWLMEMKRSGYGVVCVEQTDRSFVLGEDADIGDRENGGEGKGRLPEKCVLVLGSEREGVSKEVLVCADRCVEIRQVGVTRSLNVQTAGGIVVWEWWREWGKSYGGSKV